MGNDHIGSNLFGAIAGKCGIRLLEEILVELDDLDAALHLYADAVADHQSNETLLGGTADRHGQSAAADAPQPRGTVRPGRILAPGDSFDGTPLFRTIGGSY